MIHTSFHELTNKEWHKTAKKYEKLGYKVFVSHCRGGYSLYVWS